METNILEEQVVRLIEAVAKNAIFFDRGHYTAEEAVRCFLESAEVALHQEKIDELVEFFNTL